MHETAIIQVKYPELYISHLRPVVVTHKGLRLFDVTWHQWPFTERDEWPDSRLCHHIIIIIIIIIMALEPKSNNSFYQLTL